MGVDSGSFGDEQSARGAGSLGIKLKGEVSVYVVFVGPKPCHRTEDDTVLKAHTTNADGLE